MKMYYYTSCGLLIFLILTLTRNSAETREIKRPASGFVTHSIVQPVVHHGQTKREISSTRDVSGTHHSKIQLKVPANGEQYYLDLQLNKDLLTREHTLQYQKEGKTVQHRPKREELDFCYYTGSVRGRPDSFVAVSTCHGVRGVIHDGQTMHYIEPVQGREIQSPHYLYDKKDSNPSKNRLDHYGYINDNHVSGLFNKYNQIDQVIRKKRDTEQVRVPYNANNESLYVELVLVVNNAEFHANGGNLTTVHSKVLQISNIVNALFSQLNIYIALVGVEVWSERDNIVLDRDSLITLNRFVNYRRQKLVSEISNDVAILLANQDFLGNILGKGFIGKICTSELSGGIVDTGTAETDFIANIVAHELGHILGFNDDSQDCQCSDNICIMHGTVYNNVALPVHWSTCNLLSLANYSKKGKYYCLHNKPDTLFNSPNCGNGFIDPGEECDCGTEAGVGGINLCHACCHADTCTLRSNATCGAGTCCDFTTCNLKPAGVVCRSINQECDLPEFCTGSSEFCPADVHQMDTMPCGKEDHAAYCMGGKCRSHTQQCHSRKGATSMSAIQKCYDRNIEGTHYGNCGFNQTNLKFIPCPDSDVLCGMLQCHRPNTHFGFWSFPPLNISNMHITSNDSTISCMTVVFQDALKGIHPRLVLNGTKCGNDRMCFNQKCVSIESVREKLLRYGKPSACPSDCSGHGVCNSKGNCHCDDGFAPPLCAEPGPGGSVDSGPSGLVHIKKSILHVAELPVVPQS